MPCVTATKFSIKREVTGSPYLMTCLIQKYGSLYSNLGFQLPKPLPMYREEG